MVTPTLYPYFFFRLKETFRLGNIPKNIKNLHVFLAGNSSKSPLVIELFEKYKKAYQKEQEIEVYPPLPQQDAQGDPAASSKLQHDIARPTGKTGVAFGLVRGWGGGSVKIVNMDLDKDEGLIFQYYVGIARKNKLQPLLSAAVQKKTWCRALSVGAREIVPLYYTKLAEGGTGALPVKKAAMIDCSVEQPKQEGQSLFVRVCSADKIEWVVAASEEEIAASNIRQVHLQDE